MPRGGGRAGQCGAGWLGAGNGSPTHALLSTVRWATWQINFKNLSQHQSSVSGEQQVSKDHGSAVTQTEHRITYTSFSSPVSLDQGMYIHRKGITYDIHNKHYLSFLYATHKNCSLNLLQQKNMFPCPISKISIYNGLLWCLQLENNITNVCRCVCVCVCLGCAGLKPSTNKPLFIWGLQWFLNVSVMHKYNKISI